MWNDSVWMNQFKSCYTYNGNNTITEEILSNLGVDLFGIMK